MNNEDIQNFWSYCVECGVTCKPLAIQPADKLTGKNSFSGNHPVSPIKVVVDQAPIAYGSPIISVPYGCVLNAQTLRGGLVPPSVPPLSVMHRLLTRGNRMHTYTAQSLWLAACVAGYRTRIHRNRRAESLIQPRSQKIFSTPWKAISPLFSDTFYYTLESPFQRHVAQHYPEMQQYTEAELSTMSAIFHRHHLPLTHAIIRRYAGPKGLLRGEVPDLNTLTTSYYSVLYRSMLLPINGEPSAPGDLSELVNRVPQLVLLPSLIPLVDLIRPVPIQKGGIHKDGADGTTSVDTSCRLVPNCVLYTCQLSDFISPSSRRRVMTAPTSSVYSNRRVVICAERDLKIGEELLLGF